MAKRVTRLSHLLWHALRDHWERVPQEVRDNYVGQFGKDWVPQRRSLDENARPIIGKGAGKDFLYMHRMMIRHADHLCKKAGEPDIVRWPHLPWVYESGYPVPRDSRLHGLATKCDTKWLKSVCMAERLVHPDALAKISVDELGTMIEIGIHIDMHHRFGSYPLPGELRDHRTVPRSPHTDWDHPDYDTLLDAYSAHVHPWFWGIHTWIDAQIDTWERVHKTKVDWNGCWLGGWHTMEHHQMSILSHMPERDQAELLSAALATLPLPASCGMYHAPLDENEYSDLLDTLLRR